jgi:hypothetical protein
MVPFQTKNPNLGKFWKALDWKMLIYFMPILNILPTFGIFYNHSAHFAFIWHISPVLVSCAKKNLATLPQIPNGVLSTSANFADGVTNRGTDRFCGRYLNTVIGATTNAVVCSKLCCDFLK